MKCLTRALTAVLLAAVGALFVPARAGATHAPGVAGSLSRSWGKASFSAQRHGWGAYLSVSVSDTARDHDAVYMKAELDVADWFNPHTEVRGAGAGTTVTREGILPAGTGSAIRAIKFTLCKNVDYWPDTCVDSGWYTLPQHTAHNTNLRATADALMTAPLIDFRLQKSVRAPQWYDWTDDGCSGPLPAGLKNHPSLLASFRGACERHDFGYRNYGKYLNSSGGPGLQLGPTDSTKAWIDLIFWRDLHAACVAEPICLSWADLYYTAVRLEAGKAFYAR